MAEISAGLFFLMLGVGFFSILLSLRGGAFGTVFRLVSIIVFFGVSMLMFGGYDVTWIELTDDGTSQITTTQYIIGNASNVPDNMSQPLGWVFLALGIILSLLFLTDAFRGNI
jgi:hypothetical protein